MKKALCYLKVCLKTFGIILGSILGIIGAIYGYITGTELISKILEAHTGIDYRYYCMGITVLGLTLALSAACAYELISRGECCESKPTPKVKSKRGKRK